MTTPTGKNPAYGAIALQNAVLGRILACLAGLLYFVADHGLVIGMDGCDKFSQRSTGRSKLRVNREELGGPRVHVEAVSGHIPVKGADTTARLQREGLAAPHFVGAPSRREHVRLPPRCAQPCPR